jgi:hypothetical protein
MARTDILARANHDAIPRALFGGYYDLIGTDEGRLNAIYRRSERPADDFTIEPRRFAENLAHVSYVRDVHIDAVRVDRTTYIRRLPFLHDDEGAIPFTDRMDLVVDFAARDEHVSQISIESIRVDKPAVAVIQLIGEDGRQVTRDVIRLEPNRSYSMAFDVPPATAASQLSLDVTAEPGVTGTVWINDLRVQGQRPALEAYIAAHLRFPRNPAARR